MVKKVHFLVGIALILLCACSEQRGEQPSTVAAADSPLFWAENAGSAAERFELAKQSFPELIAFLRRMPKGGDLHYHLDGSTFSEYMLFTAREKGLNYNVVSNEFTDQPVSPGTIITTDEILSDAENLSQYLGSYSSRGWFPAQEHGRDHFFKIFPRIASSQRSLNEMLAEGYSRSAIENIQYIEAISPTVPQSVRARFADRLPTVDIDNLEAAYEAIKDLVDSKEIEQQISDYLDERENFVTASLNLSSSVTDQQSELTIRYLPYLIRVFDTRDFFIDAVTNIVSVNTDERVLAMNIVAPEDHPLALAYFDDQMRVLDFLWNKMNQPAFTLHAGELVIRDSPIEPMWSRIRETIEVGHAKRIGHGISIGWERDVAGLLQDMADNHILVEVCLTSNESILGVAGDDHPFEMYRRAGVPVSLATDDEAVNRSTLTLEFAKAVQQYELDYEEVKELVRNSIEFSFLPGDSLFVNNDFNAVHAEFEGIDDFGWTASEAAQSLMSRSEKLTRQVVLERAFAKFEHSLQNGFREEILRPGTDHLTGIAR